MVTLQRSLLVLLACFLACSEPNTNTFLYDSATDATPWSHDSFNDAEDKFTFAIFSDLNGGERQRVFEVAVEQLSLLRPELILSVGDLIEGGTEDETQLVKEWDSFDERAAQVVAPVFRVGGNHDLTNEVMRQVWETRYGTRYYHFIYKNVLFLALDSEDYTPERMREIYQARADALSVGAEDPERAQEMKYYQMPERMTGEIGPEQARYFVDVLDDYPDVRWTLLFMHKPVWQNEDEPDFAAIEAALSNRPYTLFNGHLHTYSHTIRNSRDYIMLGTTGGSQSSSSEMSFDHVTLVTMTADGPSIANIRLDGILDKTGHIPAGGDTLCFQASAC
ncbi:MAG TPA: metallophosphoesterase [Gemmatimonadetes bacterium]|jgi:3',5'-cyclic AMP phosphodiesterase CpdA|nr:metallophosphoesterase [Gemmatimonadota bacterium]